MSSDPTDTRFPQSGLFAALINISQFFIIAQTGPVSSTVVGHLKTCTIIALGWATSGRAIGDKSILGVLVAVGGIIASGSRPHLTTLYITSLTCIRYSVIMLKEKQKAAKLAK